MVRRFLAGLLWIVLLFGGGAATLLGIVLTAEYGGYGWQASLFGLTVDPTVVGGLIVLAGVLALIAAWIIDQRLTTRPFRHRD
jgi:hypothetical protein